MHRCRRAALFSDPRQHADAAAGRPAQTEVGTRGIPQSAEIIDDALSLPAGQRINEQPGGHKSAPCGSAPTPTPTQPPAPQLDTHIYINTCERTTNPLYTLAFKRRSAKNRQQKLAVKWERLCQGGAGWRSRNRNHSALCLSSLGPCRCPEPTLRFQPQRLRRTGARPGARALWNELNWDRRGKRRSHGRRDRN